jgi:hypothetical protein
VHSTICVANWTATVRPPASYTNKLKIAQMAAGHLPGTPADWEEDHRVPIEAGGHPTSPQNISPEPWIGQWGAHTKDRLENFVHRAICKGQMPLADGQAIFLGDWHLSYLKYIGVPK